MKSACNCQCHQEAQCCAECCHADVRLIKAFRDLLEIVEGQVLGSKEINIRAQAFHVLAEYED